VPLFVILVVYGMLGRRAAGVHGGGLTDALDGLIARRPGSAPAWAPGSIRWPTSCLLVTTFIVLTIPTIPLKNHLPVWLTILVISRDIVIVVVVAIVNLAVGPRTFTPSLLGKLTTATFILTSIAVMFYNYLQEESVVVTRGDLALADAHARLERRLRVPDAALIGDPAAGGSQVGSGSTEGRLSAALTARFDLLAEVPTVFCSPSSSSTFGSQPSSVRARVMSGCAASGRPPAAAARRACSSNSPAAR
jgi:cardiolipin synthase